MRSRTVSSRSTATTLLMGLAVGAAAGLAAGLLAAPVRGSEMRATLRSRAADGSARLQSLAASGRSWAERALDRSLTLLEEGRRAFNANRRDTPNQLTATVGEIASAHPGTELRNWEA